VHPEKGSVARAHGQGEAGGSVATGRVAGRREATARTGLREEQPFEHALHHEDMEPPLPIVGLVKFAYSYLY